MDWQKRQGRSSCHGRLPVPGKIGIGGTGTEIKLHEVITVFAWSIDDPKT
jgi:hypothetical protein